MAKRSSEAIHPRCSKPRQGQAIIEVTLMLPWIIFLFVAIFDFGFYAYAAICTQNAARAVALASAQTARAPLCSVALGELRGLPNVAGITSCDLLPVIVSVRQLDSTTTTPACADCGFSSSATSSLAAVTYRTIPLFPIPGSLTGQLTLTRVAEMRNLTQ